MGASGHSNKAIGQAGEFAVCVQLGKMGLIATPFAGNVPEFDIIVTNEKLACVPIQVKASFGNANWITGDAHQYADIHFDEKTGIQTIIRPVRPGNPNLIIVYIWLSREPGNPDRYFILTKGEMWALTAEAYRKWLASHNGIRPKNPASFHSAMGITDLAPWESNWDLVRKQLEGASPTADT